MTNINHNSFLAKQFNVQAGKVQEKKTENKNEAQKAEQAPTQEQAKTEFKEQGEKLLDQMSVLSSYNKAGKTLSTGVAKSSAQYQREGYSETVEKDGSKTYSKQIGTTNYIDVVSTDGSYSKTIAYANGMTMIDLYNPNGQQYSHFMQNVNGSTEMWVRNDKMQMTYQIRTNSNDVVTYERSVPNGDAGEYWQITRNDSDKVINALVQIKIGNMSVSLGDVKNEIGSNQMNNEVLASLSDYATTLTGGKFPNANQMKEIKAKLKELVSGNVETPTTPTEPTTPTPTGKKPTLDGTTLTFTNGETMDVGNALTKILDDKVVVKHNFLQKNCVVQDYSYDGTLQNSVELSFNTNDRTVNINGVSIKLDGTLDNTNAFSASDWTTVIDYGNTLKKFNPDISNEELSSALETTICDMLGAPDAPKLNGKILEFKNGKTIDTSKYEYVSISHNSTILRESYGDYVYVYTYDNEGNKTQTQRRGNDQLETTTYLSNSSEDFYVTIQRSGNKAQTCLVMGGREVAIMDDNKDYVSISLDGGESFIRFREVFGITTDTKTLSAEDWQEIIEYGKSLPDDSHLKLQIENKIREKLGITSYTKLEVTAPKVEKNQLIFANGETISVKDATVETKEDSVVVKNKNQISEYDYHANLISNETITDNGEHYLYNADMGYHYQKQVRSNGIDHSYLYKSNQKLAEIVYSQDYIALSLDNGESMLKFNIPELEPYGVELTLEKLDELITYGKNLAAQGVSGDNLQAALKAKIGEKLGVENKATEFVGAEVTEQLSIDDVLFPGASEVVRQLFGDNEYDYSINETTGGVIIQEHGSFWQARQQGIALIDGSDKSITISPDKSTITVSNWEGTIKREATYKADKKGHWVKDSEVEIGEDKTYSVYAEKYPAELTAMKIIIDPPIPPIKELTPTQELNGFSCKDNILTLPNSKQIYLSEPEEGYAYSLTKDSDGNIRVEKMWTNQIEPQLLGADQSSSLVFDQKGNLVSAKSTGYSGISHYSLEVKLNENGQYIWNEDTTEGTQAGAYGKIQKIIDNLADLLGQIDSKISIPEEYKIKGELMSAPETAAPETTKLQIVGSKITLGDKKISIPEGFEPTINEDGTVTLTKMDGDKVVEERNYDANLDRTTTTKYLDGGETKTWYYKNNKTATIVDKKGDKTTTVEYNTEGKKTSSTIEQNGVTRTYNYDDAGNAVKVGQVKVVKNDDGSTTTIDYNLDESGKSVGSTSTRDYGFGLKQVVVRNGEEKTVEYYNGNTKLDKADFRAALADAKEKAAANIELGNQIAEMYEAGKSVEDIVDEFGEKLNFGFSELINDNRTIEVTDDIIRIGQSGYTTVATVDGHEMSIGGDHYVEINRHTGEIMWIFVN